MKSKRLWAILLVALGAAAYVGSVLATPSIGFTSTTLAKAQLGELNTKVHSVPADWHAMIQTKGFPTCTSSPTSLLPAAAAAAGIRTRAPA